MQRRSLFVYTLIFLFSAGNLFAQPPDTLWTKRYSLTTYIKEGVFRDITIMSNSQYILAGTCEIDNQQDAVVMVVDTLDKVRNCRVFDFGTDENIYAIAPVYDNMYMLVGQARHAGNGDFDVLLMKTDSLGDTVWTRRYGDSWDQAAFSIVATHDSCFVIAGYTTRNDSTSMLIMKVNTDGDTIWVRTFGGSPGDTAMALVHTQDGSCVITGQREVSANNYDLHILKIDENGDSLWAKNYGTAYRDVGNAIAQSTDGGYLVTGVRANDYMYIIRTDSIGDTLWTTGYDYGNYVPRSVIVVSDTEFIVGGHNLCYSDSLAFIIAFNESGYEKWSSGISNNSICWSIIDDGPDNIIAVGTCNLSGVWANLPFIMHIEKMEGDIIALHYICGTERENAHALALCNDNGYIITGWKRALRSRTDFDILLMKTDPNGDSLWAKTYGGRRNDIGYDVIETNDNGYLVVGTTFSFGAARCDVLMLKTDANGNEEWMKTYGDEQWDIGHAVLQTSDNGYIIVGQADEIPWYHSSNDIYLIRTDVNGDTLWTRQYGDTSDEIGYDICEGINGGFLIVGQRLAEPYMFGGGLFVRINDNGDTTWTATLPGATLNSVIQASDNGYIAVGTKEHGGMNVFSDLCFVKINDGGVIQWTKNYGISNTWEGYNEGHSITQTSDGGYLGIGYSVLENGIFLVRTDEFGDSLWTKVVDSIGIGGYVDNFTVHRTPDDGYIIAGGNDWIRYSYPYHGNHHIIMVRLGPETGIQEVLGRPYATPLLFVRPTVFNRQVAIDYQTPYFGQSELNVYDVTGRLVKTLGINQDAMPSSVVWHGFNNNGLPVPSGTYYIILRSGKYEVKQKIILVH